MTPPNDDASLPPDFDPFDPKFLASVGIPTPPFLRPRATGPKTVAGKAKSRVNAVKHGLRCQVVEPPDQREKIDDRVAVWTEAMQPTDPVQRWLVARAATASVRLDRCVERENLALEENTARAERGFFRRRRAWARRLGAKLEEQTEKAYAKLTGSSFGCDWLIARFDDLAADLEITGGYWSRDEFLRALRLLGFEPKRIPPGHPLVATLYRASLTADKAPDPTEVDAFLEIDTRDLDPDARAAAQRHHLGDRERGRLALVAIVRQEQLRLRDLRETLWDETDAPALEQACARARTFDASPEAALARRYESANALELHRNLADFHRARRDAEAREEAAPNERQDGQDRVANPEKPVTPTSDPGASPASPGRREGGAEMSGERREEAGRPGPDALAGAFRSPRADREGGSAGTEDRSGSVIP